MKTFFYIPEEYLPSDAWIEAWNAKKILPLEETGCATVHAWIYQTWASLCEAGIKCKLTDELPSEGIFIALRGSLPASFGADAPLPRNLFFVDVVADGFPHPAAHFHLVQNKKHAGYLPRSLFIPHWPQPSLKPRDPKRADRLENICFFGHSENLAPELQTAAFAKRLYDEFGAKLHIKKPDQWHDYSDADVVLAIRHFSHSGELHKPATKLYNSWLAGVPFIGGHDAAYAADGHPGKNYLVAASPDEVLAHLRKLKTDEKFRTHLVEQGLLAGKNFTREATLERWKKLIQETLPPLANQWKKKSTPLRCSYLLTQRLICFIDRSLRA